jgi:hypothetical protein
VVLDLVLPSWLCVFWSVYVGCCLLLFAVWLLPAHDILLKAPL